jgi:hypothetical protein
MDDLAAARRPAIRNVVHFNPEPDALGYAAAIFAQSARLLRVRELGDRLAARMIIPSVTDLRVWLPDTTALSRDGEGLSAILANLQPVKVVIAHRAESLPRLTRLIDRTDPDAVCLAAEIDAAYAPPWLGRFDPGFDLAGTGLAGLRSFANEAGAIALTDAFARLDAARRRRLREREQLYDVSDLVACSGLYAIERDERGRWAWTGPETTATFLAPMHGGARARLTLSFLGHQRPLDAHNLQLFLNGRTFPTRYFPGEMKVQVEVVGLAEASFARFDLVQAAMVPTADHSRRVGYAFHALKVEVGP